MKNKITPIIGLVMIIIAIIFRLICHSIVENSLIDRYTTLRDDNDSMLYCELDAIFDSIEIAMKNINEEEMARS